MAIQVNAIQFHKKLHFLMTVLLLCLSALILSGCEIFAQEQEAKRGSPVMKTSISTDGQHAVTSHFNGELILWNLADKTKEIITETANIYSAYFIQHTDNFMWQDAENNEVIVQSTDGEELKRFAVDFVSYGQVMTSDLQGYFASDVDWRLHSISEARQHTIIKESYRGPSFVGTGKLFNLALSTDDNYLLSVGRGGYETIPIEVGTHSHAAHRQGYETGVADFSLFGSVVLWDVATGQPWRKSPVEHSSKTHATLSPDGKYVVSADEATRVFVWDASTHKKNID